METQKKQIVLIVDDSLLICEQIKAALKDTPIFICEAHNGQEAVDMVENYQPDLILLDVVLPDADGYSLFDKLKKADKNDAVIIDRKSTRLNSSHIQKSRMPSSA